VSLWIRLYTDVLGPLEPTFFANLDARDARTMEHVYTTTAPGRVLFCEIAARRDPGAARCGSTDPVAAVAGTPPLEPWALEHVVVEEERPGNVENKLYFHHDPLVRPAHAAGYSIILAPSLCTSRANDDVVDFHVDRRDCRDRRDVTSTSPQRVRRRTRGASTSPTTSTTSTRPCARTPKSPRDRLSDSEASSDVDGDDDALLAAEIALLL
jgi:hypothetical protein